MSIIELPSATTTIADIAEWATPLFNSFWPLIKVICAIGIVFSVAGLLIYAFNRH